MGDEKKNDYRLRVIRVTTYIVDQNPKTIEDVALHRRAVTAIIAKEDGTEEGTIDLQLARTIYGLPREKGYEPGTGKFDADVFSAIERAKAGQPLDDLRILNSKKEIKELKGVEKEKFEKFCSDFKLIFGEGAPPIDTIGAIWPKEAPFEIGRRIYGTVSQASLLDFVELRRTSTGQQGKTNLDGPTTTRDGLCELLQRLTNADISVSKVISATKKRPQADLLISPLPSRSSDDEVAKYVGSLLTAHAKYAPSPDTAFRLVTDSKEFDRVLALLKANQAVVISDWSRLAAFAFDSGWTSHMPGRLCCNVILEGVPGTGKTYALKQLGEKMANSETIAAGRFATVMHPATSYEDFVEGLRPGEPKSNPGGAKTVTLLMSAKEAPITIDLEPAPGSSDQPSPDWFFQPSATSSSSGFSIHDGFFVAACAEAVRNPNTPYVVLLDELNRCNIPKVMGDLITTMEVSKRAKWVAKENKENKKNEDYWDLSSAQVVTLPYSKRQFFVPDNLTIVGTMNTTDRSVAPMDAALRRRFVFVRVEPNFARFASTALAAAAAKLARLNKALASYLGPDAILGHSYLDDMLREIDAGADATAVEQFGFERVIFPMIVDTLANHGCMADLVAGQSKEAKAFLARLENEAKVVPTGRGITQTLKLTWKDATAPASPTTDPSDDGTPEN